MKKHLSIAIVFAVLATGAQAEMVKKACLASKRNAASTNTCQCIQAAADATLNTRDQNLAASMIRDPDKSQDVKMSNRSSMERFWERYENFGRLAEAYCS